MAGGGAQGATWPQRPTAPLVATSTSAPGDDLRASAPSRSLRVFAPRRTVSLIQRRGHDVRISKMKLATFPHLSTAPDLTDNHTDPAGGFRRSALLWMKARIHYE